MKLNELLRIVVAFIAGAAVVHFATPASEPKLSNLELNSRCSEFKTQAIERYQSEYQLSDESTPTPEEIFYSPSKNTCIAQFESHVIGKLPPYKIFVRNTVFDAITHEQYFIDAFDTDDRWASAEKLESILLELKQ